MGKKNARSIFVDPEGKDQPGRGHSNHSNFCGQGGAGWWWAVDHEVEQTFVEDGADVDKRFMSLSVLNEWVATLCETQPRGFPL